MDSNGFLSEQAMGFLKRAADEVIGKCQRRASAMTDGGQEQVNVYVPGGDDKYPSFWVRDAIMQCSSGVIPVSEMTTMLDIILRHQNGKDTRHLEHGLRVLPWAFADHINLKELGYPEPGAVFFPGSYSPTDDQGEGFFGTINAGDSPYEVVCLVHLICNRIDEPDAVIRFLQMPINGIERIDRLDFSFDSVQIDESTGLHYNSKESWAAESFHDGLKKMGHTLLGSCMRVRAARQMVQLYTLLGKDEKCAHYRALSEKLCASISRTFCLTDGWLMAATELDRQADVWGTALAVYEGVLEKEVENSAAGALLGAYNEGTVSFEGYLRHTPTTYDVEPGKQVWEDGRGGWDNRNGTFQAGGYWPQPTGWYAYALSKVDLSAARSLAREFVEHTKRLFEQGAPFEWISPNIPLEQIPHLGRWYGPSIALPLTAFRRIQGGIV